MSDLTDLQPSTMLAEVDDAVIATWSEQKRSDFCQTFEQRTLAARYILIETAKQITDAACRRHFISEKHYRDITKGFPHPEADRSFRHNYSIEQFFSHLVRSDERRPFHSYHTPLTIGGREPAQLDMIAKDRAKLILQALPPISKVVAVIDAETAKKLDRKDKLQADGEKLRLQLDGVCGVIRMSDDEYQEMTVRQFRDLVMERDNRRKDLIERMNRLTDEGQRLEEEIAKTLYAGLPGVSEAVVEVIRNHIEQAISLETVNRRVAEQVKFGDSAAAVELLRRFEKDEVEVSDKVSASFKAALEALKISVKTKKPKAKKSELRLI